MNMKNEFTVDFKKFYSSEEDALMENDWMDICRTKARIKSAIEMARENLDRIERHIDLIQEFPESNMGIIKDVQRLAHEKPILAR